MKNLLIRLLTVSAMLIAVCTNSSALAQSNPATEPWPSKTITMISPFAAGTTSDVVDRIFGQGLSKVLNVPVIVDNKVGASGNIGMAQFAKATPDGYTLAMGTITTNAINQALFSKLPFSIIDIILSLFIIIILYESFYSSFSTISSSSPF